MACAKIKQFFVDIKKFDYASFIKEMRVEPIVFLMIFGRSLSGLVYTIGTYRIICRHTIGGDNPYFNCTDPKQHGSFNGSDYAHHRHDLEDEVQKANAYWRIMLQVSLALPAFFGDSIFAVLGDRYGRKISILVGLVGALIWLYPYIALFTFPDMPLYVLVLANIAASLLGFNAIVGIGCYAYLADTVADRKNLSTRMGLIVAANYAAGISAPLLSAKMMDTLTSAQCYLISFSFYVLAFFFALILYEQIPPKIMRRLALIRYIKKYGHPPEGAREAELAAIKYKANENAGTKMEMENGISETPNNENLKNGDGVQKNGHDPKSILKNSETHQLDVSSDQHVETQPDHADELRKRTHPYDVSSAQLQKEARADDVSNPEKLPKTRTNQSTDKKRGGQYRSVYSDLVSLIRGSFLVCKEMIQTWIRPRPHRGRIYLMTLTLVYLLQMIFEAGDVTSLYVQKSPFLMGTNQLAAYRTFSSCCQFVVSLFGIAFFKKLLGFRDTSIVIYIMCAQVAQMFITAFASKIYQLWIAIAVGCMFDLLVPCLKSIMANLVEPNEVGKAYSIFGMTTTVKLSGSMYLVIYYATLTFFPGFVFLMKGCLQVICLAVMVWFHFDYKSV